MYSPPQMVLFEEEQLRLSAICERLWRDALAIAIFLIDENGQLVAAVGRVDHVDTTSLASLVAGSVAATGGLAQLLGEEDFPTHFHEGTRENLYTAKVGESLILAVIFDDRSSLGLVRLRVKRAHGALLEVYHDAIERMKSPGAQFDHFSDITDEDIDSFFSDTF